MTSETLVNFTNHPRKEVFRKDWAKPILRYLVEKLGKKLIYMGLPGIQALDIKEWLEHLRVIYAFQCLDDSKDYSAAETEYQILEDYLSSLTTKSQIEDYGLYKGFLEQVIMTGFDDIGSEFNQNDFVTVYHLDFCNPLSSPFPVIYPDTRTKDCYKLDAIEKLLEIQTNANGESSNNKFVMFMTVNSKFIETSYDAIPNREFQRYKHSLLKRSEKSRIIRLIRAYAFYHLNKIGIKHNYQIEFLPTMYYAGSGGYREKGTNAYIPTMMLTFTILGTKVNDASQIVAQNLDQFLKCKFLFATNNSLICHTEKNIQENDFAPEPVESLLLSNTYNNLW
jgi:hypothetical protein